METTVRPVRCDQVGTCALACENEALPVLAVSGGCPLSCARDVPGLLRKFAACTPGWPSAVPSIYPACWPHSGLVHGRTSVAMGLSLSWLAGPGRPGLVWREQHLATLPALSGDDPRAPWLWARGLEAFSWRGATLWTAGYRRMRAVSS